MTLEEWTAAQSRAFRDAGFTVTVHEGFPLVQTPPGLADKVHGAAQPRFDYHYFLRPGGTGYTQRFDEAALFLVLSRRAARWPSLGRRVGGLRGLARRAVELGRPVRDPARSLGQRPDLSSRRRRRAVLPLARLYMVVSTVTRKTNSSNDLRRKSSPPPGVPTKLYRALLATRDGEVVLQAAPALRRGSRYHLVSPARHARSAAEATATLVVVASPSEHQAGFTRGALARKHVYTSPGAAVSAALLIAVRLEAMAVGELDGIRRCIRWLHDWKLAAAATTERVARERGVRVLGRSE